MSCETRENTLARSTCVLGECVCVWNDIVQTMSDSEHGCSPRCNLLSLLLWHIFFFLFLSRKQTCNFRYFPICAAYEVLQWPGIKILEAHSRKTRRTTTEEVRMRRAAMRMPKRLQPPPPQTSTLIYCIAATRLQHRWTDRVREQYRNLKIIQTINNTQFIYDADTHRRSHTKKRKSRMGACIAYERAQTVLVPSKLFSVVWSLAAM